MVKTISLLIVVFIITLILIPVLSPLPCIFLFIGICFYLLSQAFSSSPEEKAELEKSLQENIFNQKAEIEEEDDKISVIENEDHIIVTETRKIMKKDLTYSDFVRYNIKNINCIGDCVSYKAEKVSGSKYKANQKKCVICDIWMDYNGINCPCCSSRLRIGTNV